MSLAPTKIVKRFYANGIQAYSRGHHREYRSCVTSVYLSDQSLEVSVLWTKKRVTLFKSH